MSYFSQFTNRQATPNRVVTFGASGNFIAPTAGWMTVAIVGAGGSGGAVRYTSNNGRATGGGAGGFAVKTFYTPAGATYVITIGAGGATATAGLNSDANGSSGGITTVVGTLCSITCNSGGGGNTTTNTATTLNGGVGGNATGGDINYTGGRGGNTALVNSGGVVTGGGAVSVNGTAFNGGDQNGGAVSGVATGGGGVGGSGGSTGTNNHTTSGGGTGGPGIQWWPNTQANYMGTPGGAGNPATVSAAPFLSFQAVGGASLNAVGNNTVTAGIYGLNVNGGLGAGGGGIRYPGVYVGSAGMSAGFGGGGGSMSGSTSNSGQSVGGPSLIGGGGGGAVGEDSATQITISGFGGNGAVYIGFYGNNT